MDVEPITTLGTDDLQTFRLVAAQVEALNSGAIHGTIADLKEVTQVFRNYYDVYQSLLNTYVDCHESHLNAQINPITGDIYLCECGCD